MDLKPDRERAQRVEWERAQRVEWERAQRVEWERAQRVFAGWLDVGTKIGFALLVIGFAGYLSGLLPPQVPLGELPKLWGLPLAKFVASTGAPTGWEWLALWSRGDYFNYFGIVLLASIVMAAYLRVLPLLAQQHDRSFAVIAALEIFVLLAAASGLLNSFGGG